MKIGKLFHLTMLVDDLAGPELFFNSAFAPRRSAFCQTSLWFPRCWRCGGNTRRCKWNTEMLARTRLAKHYLPTTWISRSGG